MGLGQAREISGQLDALCSQGWRKLPNDGLHEQRAGATMVAGPQLHAWACLHVHLCSLRPWEAEDDS